VRTLYQDCALTSVRSPNDLKVPHKLINVTNISISTENPISKSVYWNRAKRVFKKSVVVFPPDTKFWKCTVTLVPRRRKHFWLVLAIFFFAELPQKKRVFNTEEITSFLSTGLCVVTAPSHALWRVPLNKAIWVFEFITPLSDTHCFFKAVFSYRSQFRPGSSFINQSIILLETVL